MCAFLLKKKKRVKQKTMKQSQEFRKVYIKFDSIAWELYEDGAMNSPVEDSEKAED